MAHNRAPSLALFEIELDDATLAHDNAAAAAQHLRSLLSSVSKTRKQLLRDAEQALEIAGHGEAVDLHAFAEVLANKGHLVCLRTGKPSNAAQVALRHTFVVAGVTGCSQEMTASPGSSPDSSSCCTPTAAQLFVIDPSFRDAFLLSNATPAYQNLWEQLPRLFVGTADQLVTVVEFMCAQMQLVFAEAAASCPPWRTATSMISKWLPSSADDVPVLPRSSINGSSSSSPNAAAAAAEWAADALHIVPRTTSQMSSCSAYNRQSSDVSAAKRTDGHNSGSNVLLCGSLGSSSPVGVLAAAADAETPGVYGDAYAARDFAAINGGIACFVYSGVTPGSWSGKQSGYFGAASYWGGEVEDYEEPGGVAIRTNSNSTRGGQEFYRSQLSAALQQQQQPVTVARRSSALGSSSSQLRGLSPLDISRFNNSSSYSNSEGSYDLFPRSRSSSEQQKGMQQNRQDALRRDVQSSRSATAVKRRPGLLSQTSALSAAIAGQSLPC